MSPPVLVLCLSALASAGDGPERDRAPAAETLPADNPNTASQGHPYTGRLVDGVRLPYDGPFHEVQYSTRKRDWVYGTGYLVRGILLCARDVAGVSPGGEPLVIGNLSRRGGGDIKFSMSHNTGRDVDIAYFTANRDGSPVRSRYHRFGNDGRSLEAPGTFRLDLARNWAFVRAALTNTELEVQWIIVAPWIERMLIDYATAAGEPQELVFRAERTMMLPGFAKAHDNHIHLRVLCSPEDWKAGCRQAGPVWPWARKAVAALNEAKEPILKRLWSPDAADRTSGLVEIAEKQLATAVPEVAALLADIEQGVRKQAEATLVAIATEANAATILKVARWAEPQVAARLVLASLAMAGSEGLSTAAALLDGTHPLLEAALDAATVRKLTAASRRLVYDHAHAKALRPAGP